MSLKSALDTLLIKKFGDLSQILDGTPEFPELVRQFRYT